MSTAARIGPLHDPAGRNHPRSAGNARAPHPAATQSGAGQGPAAAGPAVQGPAVQAGPVLLAHLDDGPALAAHRARYGVLPRLDARQLAGLAAEVDVRGRGGAGFPLARKLTAVAKAKGRRRRTEVVVNLAEGEPASAKDATLATVVPHRVLDGAVLAATALGTRSIHVVVPSDRPHVLVSIETAIGQRREAREAITWQVHQADPVFVAGQGRAVLELLAGRANLPVTSWAPEAVSGHRGRPTLLANAETLAHLAALVRTGAADYRQFGTADEPGTTLLTVHEPHARIRIVEVAYGTPWSEVLGPRSLAHPVLLGGYHGTWAGPGQLAGLSVSRQQLAAAGLSLGAGVVLAYGERHCPVERTAQIVAYLAGESAQRCGPCRFGLPALAGEMAGLAGGRVATPARVEQLAALVEGRGACAHPDGTARLVRSLLAIAGPELSRHARGQCRYGSRGA